MDEKTQEIVTKVSEKIMENLEETMRSLLDEMVDANKEAIITEVRSAILGDDKFKAFDSRIVAIENALKAFEPKKEEPAAQTKPPERTDTEKIMESLNGVVEKAFEKFSKDLVIQSADRKSVDTTPSGDKNTPAPQKREYKSLPEEEKKVVRTAFWNSIIGRAYKSADTEEDDSE
jgi:hypothetical protein